MNRDLDPRPPALSAPVPLLDVPPARECRLAEAPGPEAQPRYRGVRIAGNTVFTDAEVLAHLQLAGSGDGRLLSVEDVECIRLALTQLYISQGFINSGVLAEPPEALGGAVLFRVVEGVLSGVRVQRVETPDGAPGRLRPAYVEDRLAGDPAAPLEQDALEGRFRALLQDPNIEQLNARLVPTDTLGEAVLDVDVVETEPLSFVIGADNFDPTSTGEVAGFIGAAARNTIGIGDAVTLEFRSSQGRQSFGLDVALPVSAEGLLLVGSAEYVQTEVVEEPLDALEIRGEFLRTSIGLDWRAHDIGTERLTFGLRFDFQQSESFLLDERFSFSPGAEDGVTRASVLRLFAEYVQRSEKQAFSVRGTGSVGLPILNGTQNAGTVPDAAFATTLAELFYVRSIALPALDRDLEMALRAVSQVSLDPLLPFEQVALTGADAVRGFREDAVVDDNLALIDVSAKTELFRLALPGEAGAPGRTVPVTAQTFVTAGTVWPNGGFGDKRSAVGSGFVLTAIPAPGVALSAGFAAPVFASDAVDALDVAAPRAYLSAEYRF